MKYSYEISENGFTFVFFRKTHKVASPNDKIESNVTVNVAANVTLNKTEQAVYNLLVKNPDFTREELSEATSKTVRTIQRTLDSLRKKDLIERIGSDKSGYWKVKNS